jgi:hypothetical protein
LIEETGVIGVVRRQQLDVKLTDELWPNVRWAAA